MNRPRGRDEVGGLPLRGTADLDSLPTNAPVAFFPRRTLDVGAERLDQLTSTDVSLSLTRADLEGTVRVRGGAIEAFGGNKNCGWPLELNDGARQQS